VVSYVDPLKIGEMLLTSEVTDDPDSVGAPNDPSHKGYKFIGWEKLEDAGGNTIYVAKYKLVDPDKVIDPDDDPGDDGKKKPKIDDDDNNSGKGPNTGDPSIIALMVLCLGAAVIAVRAVRSLRKEDDE